MTGRTWRGVAGTVVALALAARVVAAFAMGGALYFADEADYVDSADRLLAGGGFGPGYDRVPAYPLLLAALRAVSPTTITGVRVLQAAAVAAGCLLVLLLAVRTFGRVTALAAGVVYALDPMAVVGAGLLYPDAIAAVVLLGVVVLALAAARYDDGARSAGVGLGLGILAQLRPVGLVLVPVVAAWTALTVHATMNRRALHLLAVPVGCLVALAPWTIRNYRVRGGFVPIATAGIGAAPVPAGALEQDGVARSLVREAWSDPTGFALHVGREFRHFWELYPQRLATDNQKQRVDLHEADPRLPLEPFAPPKTRDVVSAASFGPELLLAGVGMVLAWRSRRRETALIAAIVLAYAAGYALFVGKLRYRITVLPLVFLFTGRALAALVRRGTPATR
jgi:hypothetical protein